MDRFRQILYAMALVAAGAFIVHFSGGSGSSPQTDAGIHDALIRHPEWLVEMSDGLREKQRAQQRTAMLSHAGALFHDRTDPTVGNLGAKSTIVEFFDYSCPFCKRERHVIDTLTKGRNQPFRIVLKEFPMLTPASRVAAIASLACWQINSARFLEFHDALLADRSPEGALTESRVLQIAQSAGYDKSALRTAMNSPALARKVDQVLKLGNDLGIGQTPTLVLQHEDGRIDVFSGFIDTARIMSSS